MTKPADTRGIRELAKTWLKEHNQGYADIGDMTAFAESIVEQCCKDVCEDCKRGDVPQSVLHDGIIHWMHKGKFAGFHECEARAIRSRWQRGEG